MSANLLELRRIYLLDPSTGKEAYPYESLTTVEAHAVIGLIARIKARELRRQVYNDMHLYYGEGSCCPYTDVDPVPSVAKSAYNDFLMPTQVEACR